MRHQLGECVVCCKIDLSWTLESVFKNSILVYLLYVGAALRPLALSRIHHLIAIDWGFTAIITCSPERTLTKQKNVERRERQTAL